jgi:hypothetical protein
MSPDAAQAWERVKQAHAANDPKAWAWRLRARELSGERLSLVQRRFWREALGVQP